MGRFRAVIVVAALVVAELAWSFPPGGSAATLRSSSATVAPDGGRCAGAEAWMEEAWERGQRAALVTQRFPLSAAEGPPYDAELFDDLAEDLRVMAREQRTSSPPPAGQVLSALLVERMEKYAGGLSGLAEGVRRGNGDVGDDAADLTHEASQLGQRVPDAVARFKSECGLEDTPAFEVSGCFGSDFYPWYLLATSRLNRVETVVASAFERTDEPEALRATAAQVEDFAGQQERSQPVDIAAPLSDLTVDLFRVYAEALEAAADGRFDDVDRLSDRAVNLGDRIAAEDERLNAACRGEGHEAASATEPPGTATTSAPAIPTATAGPPATVVALETRVAPQATEVAAARGGRPSTTVGSTPECWGATQRVPAADPPQYGAPPAMVIDPAMRYTALLTTNKGTITLDLFADEAPQAVNNLVCLARDGYFDGTPFHRIVKGFVVQGGDPSGTGAGGPGYTFADEPVIRDYEEGTVAMANAGPNTNGSQFFIVLADLRGQLPKDYTIFGRVTGGQEAVEALAAVPTRRTPGGEQSQPTEVTTLEAVEIVEEGP